MAILNIFTTQIGQQNSKERLVRVHCTDTLAQVQVANYLSSYLASHGQNIYASDTVLVAYSGGQGFFTPIFTGTNLTLQVGNLFANGLPVQSISAGVTAHAGGTQAAAVPIISSQTNITTVASAGDSVVLPAATGGVGPIWIANSTATSANVFPPVGGTINELSVNTAFALAAGKNAAFFNPTVGAWYAVLTA